jgi:hypothetical protein
MEVRFISPASTAGRMTCAACPIWVWMMSTLTEKRPPARLAVEPRIVTGAVQRLVGRVVGEQPPLVRAEHRIGHDVAVRPDAALDRLPELDEDAGAVGVGIGDVHRFVGGEIGGVGQPVRRIVDPGEALRLGPARRQDGCRRGAGSTDKTAAQELAPADIDHAVALHG